MVRCSVQKAEPLWQRIELIEEPPLMEEPPL